MEKKSDQPWLEAELPEDQRTIILQPGKTLRCWGSDSEREAHVQLPQTRTETTIVQSVTITRTRTIVGAVEHTVIDDEQLPAKLRAAEFWARHASGGAATRVMIHEHDPELAAAIEAAARRSEPKQARVKSWLNRRDKRGLAATTAGVVSLAALAGFLSRPPSQAPKQPAPLTTQTAPQRPSPSPSPAVAIPAPQPSAAVPSGVTPRSAVDALISGQYPTAIDRYRELARAHPDQPAYEAAARILSRKAH